MNASVGILIKGGWAGRRARPAGLPGVAVRDLMRPVILRLLGVFLAVVAGALLWLAFTQFDSAPPQPGAPGFGSYEEAMMRDAQVSVALGLAGCFALLGAFACLNAARRSASGPSLRDGP